MKLDVRGPEQAVGFHDVGQRHADGACPVLEGDMVWFGRGWHKLGSGRSTWRGAVIKKAGSLGVCHAVEVGVTGG